MSTSPRNKPCSCGSGIKFKKCCWNPTRIVPATVPPLPLQEPQTSNPPTARNRMPMALMMMAAAAMSSATYDRRSK